MTENCGVPKIAERSKCFWATQPCGCGNTTDSCGNDCCVPGLRIERQGTAKTILNDNWVQSLILNILNTDKRVSPTICGYRPNAVKGHWSESFIGRGNGLNGKATSGYRVGTGIRQINTKGLRVTEIRARFEAELTASMQKLVLLGVAASVRVEVEYRGGNAFSAIIHIGGFAGAPDGRVALTAQQDGSSSYFWRCS